MKNRWDHHLVITPSGAQLSQGMHNIDVACFCYSLLVGHLLIYSDSSSMSISLYIYVQ